MEKFLRIIFVLFSVFFLSCSSKKQKQSTLKIENCFELKNDYAYLNFYNFNDSIIEVPDITRIVDANLILISDIKQSTIRNELNINVPENSVIQVSHGDFKVDTPKIKSYSLGKGQFKQQVFKLNGEKNLSRINLIFKKDTLILDECKR